MLAIGRALMTRPTVLLLDEPSLGLAPILVQQIFKIIREINASGMTILLVEQNALQALSIANRGYVLQTGEVVLSGSAQDLGQRDRPQGVPRRGLTPAAPVDDDPAARPDAPRAARTDGAGGATRRLAATDGGARREARSSGRSAPSGAGRGPVVGRPHRGRVRSGSAAVGLVDAARLATDVRRARRRAGLAPTGIAATGASSRRPAPCPPTAADRPAATRRQWRSSTIQRLGRAAAAGVEGRRVGDGLRPRRPGDPVRAGRRGEDVTAIGWCAPVDRRRPTAGRGDRHPVPGPRTASARAALRPPRAAEPRCPRRAVAAAPRRGVGMPPGVAVGPLRDRARDAERRRIAATWAWSCGPDEPARRRHRPEPTPSRVARSPGSRRRRAASEAARSAARRLARDVEGGACDHDRADARRSSSRRRRSGSRPSGDPSTPRS